MARLILDTGVLVAGARGRFDLTALPDEDVEAGVDTAAVGVVTGTVAGPPVLELWVGSVTAAVCWRCFKVTIA